MCNVLGTLIDEVVEERPRLENAPLKSVICQAWFPRQLSLGDDDVKPIREALSHRYPKVVEEQAMEVTLDEGPSPKPLLTAVGARQRIFQFRDAGGDWTATIGPEAISLETTAYVGMKDLLLRWSELATAAGEALELTAQTSLRLRYINELDCPAPPDEDLSAWVREELIIMLKARPRDQRPRGFVSQAEFRQPDGSSCNMRHGLTPTGEGEDRTVFLLDLDCFRGEEEKFDPAGQIRSLARLNNCAYSFFNWAFSARTLESFGTRHPAGLRGPWSGKRAQLLVRGERDPHGLEAFSTYLDCPTPAAVERHLPRHFLLAFESSDSAAVPIPPNEDEVDSRGIEPLSDVLQSIRESIDLSVADLARMVGLHRRQFYNLLRGSPTTTETEARVRRVAAAIERLAAVTEGGPEEVRAAVLTPVGPDALNFFEVAAAGDDDRLVTTVETLLVRLETRGVRRTRRAIPRRVPPGVAAQRERLIREALADGPARPDAKEGGNDRE